MYTVGEFDSLVIHKLKNNVCMCHHMLIIWGNLCTRKQ